MADDIAALLAGAAKTNANFDFGGIADAYYKGREQSYQQAARDAFKDGLPIDPKTGSVDWTAVADKLVKTGGAKQIGDVISIMDAENLRKLSQQPPISFDQPQPQQRTTGPQSSNQYGPPSLERTASVADDVPSGTPAPPGQNLTGPNVRDTTISYGPVQTAGKSGTGGTAITARAIAGRVGADPTQIASSLGVSPDDPLDPTDQAVRSKIVQTVSYLKGGPPGGQSSQPQISPQVMALAAPGQQGPQNPLQNFPQVASPQEDQPNPMQAPLQAMAQQLAQNQSQPQAQPQGPAPAQQFPPQQQQPPPVVAGPQGNISEANAIRYERIAAEAIRRANIAGASKGGAALAATYKTQAEMAMKQAEIIRGALADAAKPTTEQKNSGATGYSSPGAYEVAKGNQLELGKQDITDFNKRYTDIQSLGENSYSGLEKAKLMKQLTLDPNFYSGPLVEGVKTYNQFRAIFGQNPSTALSNEAFNKVASDMLTEQIKSMGKSGVGRVLMSEVAIMQKALASENITPQTNRALAEMVSRVYKKQQDIYEIARRLPRVPGQMNSSLDTAVADYLKKNPMFSPEETKNPSLLGAPDAPPEAASWSVPMIHQWAKGIGLKSGDTVRINGQIVKIPKGM